MSLLSYALEAKWAITHTSLDAIVALVQDHSLKFERSTFHQGDSSLREAIGSVGSPISGTQFSSQSGNVGVLRIDGPIIPRSVDTESSGPSASLERFMAELKMMDANPNIRQIVLSFDTPGGTVTGVDEFTQFLKTLNTPLTGYVYGYAASAGYWIASSLPALYGNSTSEVGSIGTVAIFNDTSAANEKRGIKQFEFVSNLSPNKRLDPTSDAGKMATMKILDQITELFVDSVAKGRKTTSQNVLDTFGQGSMFIASEAVSIGMMDGITTLDALVAKLNTETIQTFTPTKRAGEHMTQPISAEDFKVANPSAYTAILAEGASQERDRLQAIESLKSVDASVSSFIDSKKYDADMTKASMALAIFESKDAITAIAAEQVKTSGADLLSKVEAIAVAPTAQPEANEKLSMVADMVAGAQKQQKQHYGYVPKGK